MSSENIVLNQRIPSVVSTSDEAVLQVAMANLELVQVLLKYPKAIRQRIISTFVADALPDYRLGKIGTHTEVKANDGQPNSRITAQNTKNKKNNPKKSQKKKAKPARGSLSREQAEKQVKPDPSKAVQIVILKKERGPKRPRSDSMEEEDPDRRSEVKKPKASGSSQLINLINKKMARLNDATNTEKVRLSIPHNGALPPDHPISVEKAYLRLMRSEAMGQTPRQTDVDQSLKFKLPGHVWKKRDERKRELLLKLSPSSA